MDAIYGRVKGGWMGECGKNLCLKTCLAWISVFGFVDWDTGMDSESDRCR